MKFTRKIGGYEQEIQFNGKLKVWCTCKHFSLFPNNFYLGEQICWHLKSALIQLRRRKNEKTQQTI